MYVTIGVPPCLPLGAMKIEAEGKMRTCLLGLTLQHPPIHLEAQAHNQHMITGGRADIGFEHLQAFHNFYGLSQGTEIEIELAIPAYSGLGSDALLGIAVAKAMAWANQLPHTDMSFLTRGLDLEPIHGLEIWGASKGGALLIDTTPSEDGMPRLIKRAEIKHDDRNAWGVVLVFPRVLSETSETFERERLLDLLQAVGNVNSERGGVVNAQIWSAIEQDDLSAFGQSIVELQSMNQMALEEAGLAPTLTERDNAILQIMEQSGAVHCGQSPIGLALYALVRGAQATIDMRNTLRTVVDHFSGHMLATIVDNRGAQLVEKQGQLTKGAEMRV